MNNNKPSDNINLNDSDCPYRELLNLIGDKWSTLIIKELTRGTMRYSKIKRRSRGISHKMLAQTLRKLEEKKLVKRVVYPVVPPHVEYTLTPLGETLIEPLKALGAWAEMNKGVLIGVDTEDGQKAHS